jgi:hypothetical protein
MAGLPSQIQPAISDPIIWVLLKMLRWIFWLTFDLFVTLCETLKEDIKISIEIEIYNPAVKV